jgi:hypothetical protein
MNEDDSFLLLEIFSKIILFPVLNYFPEASAGDTGDVVNECFL